MTPTSDSDSGVAAQRSPMSLVANDPDARRDAEHLIATLTMLHRAAAKYELRGQSDGAFASAVFADPLPVVVDANWLRGDIGHACRHDRRTVLVTAANEQFIRAFCARHVVEEVVEHAAAWCDDPRFEVVRDDFLRRFRDEYLPVLRVVPDDGVPDEWLCPTERQQIAHLRSLDPDDVPSVKLALALRGLYVSDDANALQAVHGDAGLPEHRQWLEYLRAGGDIGQLRRMLFSTAGGVWLVGYGLVATGRRLADWVGLPLTLLSGLAMGVALYRWVRQPAAEPVRAGGRRVLDVLAVAAELMEERRLRLDAALPPDPQWLDNTADRAATVGRAALRALARDSHGHRSAAELTPTVRIETLCNERQIRSLLRSTPCFDELRPGRWQVGAALTVRLGA